MKKIIGFLFFLTAGIVCKAQAVNWQWSESFIGGGRTQMVVDELGNTYVTGSFENAITIGDSTFTSLGNTDIFVAKFNALGQFVWANHAGGATPDLSKAISVDKTGTVYITGIFTDTAYFNNYKLVSVDSAYRQYVSLAGDIFIAKYNSSGQIVWAKQAGSKYADVANGLTLDRTGHLYVCGGFASYVAPNPRYGTAFFDNIQVTALGFGSVFIAQYDTSGNALWVNVSGGNGFSTAYVLSVDIHNHVLCAGVLGSSYSYFDTIRVNSVIQNGSNVFLAKYDVTGNVIWAKAAGGEGGTISIDGCTTDTAGNILITGTTGSADTYFDGYTLHNDLIGAGVLRKTAFLAKYDKDGTAQWAKNICSNTIDYTNGYGIVADRAGNAYVSGSYGYYCSVKPGDTLRSYGNYDAYVAKFDGNGNGIWATHAGGTGGESPYSIGMDGSGSLYVAGTTTSTTSTFGNVTLNGSGRDIFIARLSGTTGIPRVSGEDDRFSIFPNPASRSITMRHTAGFTGLRIIDVQGKEVLHQLMNPLSKEETFNLPDLVPGVYFVRLQGRQGLATRKLMIQ